MKEMVHGNYDRCQVQWHLTSYLKSHRKSTEHLNSHKKWIVFSEGLKKSQTVNAHVQRHLNTESRHWKNFLGRLISIIHFLGQHCLPWRGSTDTLVQPDNRNFLKLVELFGKFDTVMMEHVHRTKKGETKGHHYLGKETKNEIIHLIGSSITNNILLMMKSAKSCSSSWNIKKSYWESSIDDLTPPRFQIGDIYDALIQISGKFNVTNQLKAHCDYFDFLYNIDEMKNAPPDSLDTKCPKEILKFMGRYNFCPNVNIGLRILLTLSVIVASGKRSFSKLKLIKTYLQSMLNTLYVHNH
ncbi:uncharacterized protein LOC126297980 [Schistocerca gregaria]|uniref:uncharacterized protein LOC126297980 n=1 Tax=Schistocerca gregaria TaxID=7010 RepID=UPI00211E18DA|nr:uncharacterized protein LOC126297980 [Schistocerca gregaria]